MNNYYLDINGTFTNVTTWIKEDLILEERLDKVLDSGSFFMNSSTIDKNIAPFTKFKIEDGEVTKYYYCSSICYDTLSNDSRYYHQVQLVEPTKVLEAFIVGTKSFSIIEEKENYNTNYDRIKILCKLISEKYGITITLDSSLNILSEEREYSFGTGYTLYDCLEEIMNTQNAIPRVKGWNDNGDIILSCDNLNNLETSTITQFTQWNYKENNQLLDDYCSSLESELSEVVDRDTVQTCYLSCRSKDDIMSKGNSCLIAPSKIEDIKKFEIVKPFICKGTQLFLIEKSDLDSFTSYVNSSGKSNLTNSNGQVVGTSYLLTPPNYSTNNYFLDLMNTFNSSLYVKIKNYLESINVTNSRLTSSNSPGVSNQIWIHVYNLNYINVLVDYPSIQSIVQTYYVCMIYDDYGFSNNETSMTSTIESIDATNYVLNEEQWNLLDADNQPDYLFFKSGSNYIDGFYNTKDSELWNKMIYGEKGPFMKDFLSANLINLHQEVVHSNRESYYADYVASNYDSMNSDYGFLVSSEMIPLYVPAGSTNGIKSYDDALDEAYSSNDFLTYVYKVKYTTKSPMFLKFDKTVGATNEAVYKASSRSFNNGASTIDYNQLVPAIERATNMLGLEQRSIISQDDLPIGTRTQFGYIISKKSNIYPLYSEFTYNCCDNYQQIAAAIGVRTQYEATNLPQTGIVDRFIYDEVIMSNVNYNNIIDNDNVIYLALQITNNVGLESATPLIAKSFQKLENNGYLTLVCEANDNYEYDNQSTNGYNNYRKKNPIKYCDDSNYIELFNAAYICTINLDKTVDVYNLMPKIRKYNITNFANVFENKHIYKDPRERLIFVVRVKKEE